MFAVVWSSPLLPANQFSPNFNKVAYWPTFVEFSFFFSKHTHVEQAASTTGHGRGYIATNHILANVWPRCDRGYPTTIPHTCLCGPERRGYIATISKSVLDSPGSGVVPR